MGEEGGSFACGFTRGFPRRLQNVENGMPGKGQQVQGGQVHGQEFLAMAEAVLEHIAVVFHHVKAFVLDFPARPPAGGDLRNGEV